jgi:hypothetical protein
MQNPPSIKTNEYRSKDGNHQGGILGEESSTQDNTCFQIEHLRLWSEGEENFEARLEEILVAH